MKEFSKQSICDGVELVTVHTDRFKTNEMAISFLLPLTEETAARNALTISLLSNCSEEYPDMLSIKKKTAYLYGASIESTVQKIGENQSLQLTVSSLDDRFSLGDSISEQTAEMLISLITKPRLNDDGIFYSEDIDREKRILIQKIQSEENEKRIYALNEMQKTMFEGEPFSVNKYGSVDSIKALTPADVKAAWNNFLSNAKIQITCIGSSNENKLAEMLKKAFSEINRSYHAPVAAVFVPAASEIKEKEECIDVKQGKLVLGYRVNMKPDDEHTSAMRAFCDVFGGGPYSKLFANVREKLSLCYYCSARYDRRKSVIIIQCGCEKENMDKAVAEIENQLNEIKAGNFDEELKASKAGLCDAINSANDDSLVLLGWYSSQSADAKILSPSESSKQNEDVIRADVQKCASLLSLDTVYKLYGNKEAE